MKLFVIGLSLCLALMMSGFAKGAEEVEHRVSAFDGSLKEAMKRDGHWRACGNYFAGTETTEGKIIHFHFEKMLSGELITVFAFSTVDRVFVLISEMAEIPMVMVLGNGRNGKFILRMNARDYVAGLPCLAKGTGV